MVMVNLPNTHHQKQGSADKDVGGWTSTDHEIWPSIGPYPIDQETLLDRDKVREIVRNRRLTLSFVLYFTVSEDAETWRRKTKLLSAIRKRNREATEPEGCRLPFWLTVCMSATPFGNNDLLPRSQSATWQISTLSRSSQEKKCTAGGRDYCRRVFATSIILIVILIIIRLL